MTDQKKLDTSELELPETLYIRDIDTNLFRAILGHVVEQTPGIHPLGGSFLKNFMAKGEETFRGIEINHDGDQHSIGTKVEVNIEYGLSIPEKAEELQNNITRELTELTGLHVSSVHLVFRGLVPTKLVEATQTEEVEA